MADRRLGAPPLGGKRTPDFSGPKLRGKLAPYVPRGAQYDYEVPSVFARYKVLTAVFAVALVTLFGYWAMVFRHSHAANAPLQRTQAGLPTQPTEQSQPQSDPVYIEPLPSPR